MFILSLLLPIIVTCLVYANDKWRQLLKSFVFSSMSLEQAKFEEEFKFSIVTSTTNETSNQTPRIQNYSAEIFCASSTGLMLYISIVDWDNTQLASLIIAYTILCYLLYKHQKFTALQSLHKSAMDSIHRSISLSLESEKLQSLLIRSLKNYSDYQQQFGGILLDHLSKFTHIVEDLQPLIDSNNLARLKDMYKINKEMPTALLISEGNEYSMQDITDIYLSGLWERHDYFLHLLALSKHWKQAVSINESLIQHYTELNEMLKKMIDDLPATITDSAISVSDKQVYTITHKLSTVEAIMKDIEGGLFLCQQDAKLRDKFSIDKLAQNFEKIDRSIKQLTVHWEESKQCLMSCNSSYISC